MAVTLIRLASDLLVFIFGIASTFYDPASGREKIRYCSGPGSDVKAERENPKPPRYLFIGDFTVFEKENSRDITDTEFLGDCWIAVNIQFANDGLFFIFLPYRPPRLPGQ